MKNEKRDGSKFSYRGTGGYLTKEQAIQKLRQYCGYQERSHSEVQQKLWDLNVLHALHGEIIASLIEDDYLNEERFAKLFAGGKFRMKSWGKKKIYHALKEKKLSDYVIKSAMNEIDEDSYKKTLLSLAEKKYLALKAEQHLVRKKKTTNYLLQKGYGYEEIGAALKTITTKE